GENKYFSSAITVLHYLHENSIKSIETSRQSRKKAFGEQDLQHLWHRNILKQHHHRLYKHQETRFVYLSGHNSEQKPSEGDGIKARKVSSSNKSPQQAERSKHEG
ncbi:unnamed protein product, partial [Bubo scandiacus]